MAPSWDTLPKEIRLMVLARTNLVRKRDWEWDSRAKVGANILDGRLMAPRGETDEDAKAIRDDKTSEDAYEKIISRQKDIGRKLPFPFPLFLVSHQMHDEAMQFFFSQNRFILKGDLKDSHRFLYDLPDSAVRCIRALDLELSFWQIISGLGALGVSELQQWNRLIDLIRCRCRLDRLWLTVDASCSPKDPLPIVSAGQELRSWLPKSYARVFKPLEKLKGVQKYHVFLRSYLEYEAIAEKEVMGPDYDSAADGKLPFHMRSSCSPHYEIPKSLLDDVKLLSDRAS